MSGTEQASAGLSILVLTYNDPVSPLFSSLQPQIAGLDFPTELLLLENGSPDLQLTRKHRQLCEKYGFRHRISAQNLGRGPGRNRLAREARYPWLLFIDGDMEAPQGFLAHYAPYLREPQPYQAFMGGHHYPPPEQYPGCELHHRYGTRKECPPAPKRNRQPYRSLLVSNLLIKQEAFWAAGGFDERLKGYGHEDTCFGYALEDRQIPIMHIENRLCHRGLEPNAQFLRKTESAMRNLRQLFEHAPQGRRHRLYPLYRLSRFPGMRWVFLSLFLLAAPLLRRNLLSPAPSLKEFQEYKLLYLLSGKE